MTQLEFHLYKFYIDCVLRVWHDFEVREAKARYGTGVDNGRIPLRSHCIITILFFPYQIFDINWKIFLTQGSYNGVFKNIQWVDLHILFFFNSFDWFFIALFHSLRWILFFLKKKILTWWGVRHRSYQPMASLTRLLNLVNFLFLIYTERARPTIDNQHQAANNAENLKVLVLEEVVDGVAAVKVPVLIASEISVKQNED